MLVTEWPEFAGLDLRQLAGRMNKAVLIDGRNLFHPEKAREAGFEYAGIGRARSRRRMETRPQNAKRGAARLTPTAPATKAAGWVT